MKSKSKIIKQLEKQLDNPLVSQGAKIILRKKIEALEGNSTVYK